MVEVINDRDFKYTKWNIDDSLVRIDYPTTGYGVYSNKYELIVVMEYGRGNSLNATAYNRYGFELGKITPFAEDIIYEYISIHPSSASGVAIVGTYSNLVDNFQYWFFEVDLENFIIGKRLSPAY
ncbi:hypothetical protein [Aeromonas veronii]|uniref:hypothetical protein n=1 Tax=Aeromonas TaxID=642 RepID=UPI0032EFD73C